jgi:hypothetical protein
MAYLALYHGCMWLAPRNGTKFRLLRIAACLLLGAAINTVVAWIAYFASDPVHGRIELGYTAFKPGHSWWFRAGYGRASTRYESWPDSRSDARGTLVSADIPAPSWQKLNRAPGPGDSLRIVELWGWPMRSLWRQSFRHVDNHAITAHPDGSAAPAPFNGGPDARSIRRLPLQPFWPGFVIDTLLYGAAVWLLDVLWRKSFSWFRA